VIDLGDGAIVGFEDDLDPHEVGEARPPRLGDGTMAPSGGAAALGRVSVSLEHPSALTTQARMNAR
jgi:hypothetical protein